MKRGEKQSEETNNSLVFPTANLILQAPSDVFEEDSVVLRCQAKANIVLNNLTLYKNGKILKILNKTSDFHIHQASMKDSGEYYCSGVKDTHFVSSNKIQIVVQGKVFFILWNRLVKMRTPEIAEDKKGGLKYYWTSGTIPTRNRESTTVLWRILVIKGGIFSTCFCMFCLRVPRMNCVFLQSSSKPHFPEKYRDPSL